MNRYAFLVLMLLPTLCSARQAGETVTATNPVVRGLLFAVSSTQQIDILRIDITAAQTNGGNDVITKMGGNVALGRRLMAPLAPIYTENTVTFRVFVAPNELKDTTLTLIHSYPVLGTVGGCQYRIDLGSFLKKEEDSEPRAGVYRCPASGDSPETHP